MQNEHSLESMTLSRLLREFEVQHPELEEGTQYMRRLGFEYLMATVGDKALADFQRADAEAFRAALLMRWKPVTAASYLKMVRPPFRWWQYRQKTFCDFWADLPKIKVPRTQPKMYSDAEVKAILDGSEEDELLNGRATLMVTTAMRRGEVLNLRRENIDWDNGIITVEKHEDSSDGWPWIPKDKDCRQVPLTPQVRDMILRRQMTLPCGQPYLMLSEDRYAYLMWLKSRGKLTARMRKCPDENFKPFRKLRRKIGITDKANKHFRNTCLTNWLRDGLDLRTVADLAGHTSMETTEAYIVATSAVKKAGELSSARLARLRSGS
jgi:integrase